MFNLDATDKLEAIVASDTNKVMFTVSGHDATSGVISNQGYVTTSNTEIYDAVGATRIYSFTAYNSHTSAITITLNKDPGDVGTLWTFFKVSLGVGYSLYFDGIRFETFDANGGFVTGVNVSDTAYAASWDGVTAIAPSKNAVYDQVELKAPLISPSFTTPDLDTPSAGVLTNCTGLPVDFVQASDAGIATNDTMALVFAFVPSEIIINYSGIANHDTSNERGHTTGQCRVIITGTDTFTSNLNFTYMQDQSGTWTASKDQNDTTNVVKVIGGFDGSNSAIVTGPGAWVTATKTLTLTFTSVNANDAINFIELIATAYA